MQSCVPLRRNLVRSLPRSAAATAAVLLLTTTGTGAAAESGGCAAINRGELTSVLEAGAQLRPMLTLGAGERVTFTVAGGTLGSATVDLTSGEGAPRSLIAGSGSRSAILVVPADGLYGLRLAASDAALASFSASCQAIAATQSSFLGW